jgi:hypothetical protein
MRLTDLHYSFLPIKHLDATTLALLLGLLNLATKYQVDSMRDHIISRLEKDWPMNLKAWDTLIYASEEISSDSVMDTDIMGFCQTELLPDPIPFIPLAAKADHLNLLGILFYSLCPDSGLCRARLSRMEPTDLITLMLGKRNLIRAICQEAKLVPTFFQWLSGCKQCEKLIMKVWSDILEDVMYHGDPLTTIRATALVLQNTLNEWRVAGGITDMCPGCLETLVDHLSNFRHRLFTKLPFFFFAPEEKFSL